jgi:hypothetical protein
MQFFLALHNQKIDFRGILTPHAQFSASRGAYAQALDQPGQRSGGV